MGGLRTVELGPIQASAPRVGYLVDAAERNAGIESYVGSHLEGFYIELQERVLKARTEGRFDTGIRITVPPKEHDGLATTMDRLGSHFKEKEGLRTHRSSEDDSIPKGFHGRDKGRNEYPLYFDLPATKYTETLTLDWRPQAPPAPRLGRRILSKLGIA
jgi:hypothetical protein